jgi:hypothetical protein
MEEHDTDQIQQTVDLALWQTREFIFDGIKCVSILAVLESFQAKDLFMQRMVCKKTTAGALMATKTFGRKNAVIKMVYWNGGEHMRGSPEYSRVLSRLFDAVFEHDETFRTRVGSTLGAELPSIKGEYDQSRSLISIPEIESNLYRLRIALES